MIVKKYIYFISLLLIYATSCAQKNYVLFSKVDKIKPRINIPLSADYFVTRAANEFKENFKTITGENLIVEKNNKLNNNYQYIVLRVNPTQKNKYCIYKKGNDIYIQATDAENLVFGVYDFFERFTQLNLINPTKNAENTMSTIQIPNQLSVCASPDFEYREPYFSTNFDQTFRFANKTSYLELEWGIWGHNLNKILKKHPLPETVYAKVGSRRDKNQFCFTSDSLFVKVNAEVQRIYNSDHALNKYMILPNDNSIVCTCNTCKAVGNTSNDAAPAVFTFLNKLAKNYKNLTFFTADYITVKNIPKFDAAKNVGVFYSTIAIQKGIPIENSEYFKEFERNIKKWRKYLSNVYIWDYTVNFDNYFDIYPIVKVTQQNLQLYKKLGVNGVFLHGSEYQYSTFQGLKSTLFAKLLWDTSINVEKEIENYFNQKFSKSLANALSNYYTFIDNSFFLSKEEMGIYSGLNKSVKKYLDPKLFFSFYDDFDKYTESNKYDKEYLKIATALTFLKLEIMRDYGFGVYGFATLNKNKEIIVKNDAGLLLDKLKTYSKSANLTTYNEVKFTIDEYIKSWRKTIYRYHKRTHYFYKKPFKVLSKLDEDYTNTSILNDGAFGLNDYNTNWHISSIDDLTLLIDKKSVAKSKKIILSFLQDEKHRIFYPESIEILDTDYKLIKKVNLANDYTTLDTKEITIELPTRYDDLQLPEQFIIRVKKNRTGGKNSLACDEIIFN